MVEIYDNLGDNPRPLDPKKLKDGDLYYIEKGLIYHWDSKKEMWCVGEK